MKKADILIVENDDTIAHNLLTRLHKVGYREVSTVASGEKALERTAQSLPDLVLMDIVLKGRLDGIETVQEIRRQQLSTAVVYLTAYSDEVSLKRAKKTEPQGYLVKPVKDYELFTAVDLALIKIQNERREQHLRTVLNTLVQMHRLFIRHDDEWELLSALCALLTENRSYMSAWIMLLDEERRPRHTVSSNIKGDIKKLAQAVINKTPPRCLQKTLAGNEVIVTEDIQSFCQDCPLVNGYGRSGITSTPIKFKNNLLGILTIALPDDFCHDQEEQGIIRNIASDIGYALHKIRLQNQRKQAETALNVSRNRLREAQDIAGLGYWEINADTLEITGSDQVYTILQRSPENPITTRAAFQALIHPEDRSAAIQAMDTLLADDTDTPYDLVYRVLMPDGRFKHLHMKARMHRDNRGRPVRVMGVMQDVSIQKKMEQRLMQTEKMATIAGLAAGVAHELNTPLSAILQSIQIIELALDPKNDTAEKQAKQSNIDLEQLRQFFAACKIDYFLDGIKNSATNASRIINNLLQFSRPKTGEWVKISAQEMITNSIELARTDYALKKEYNILNIDFQTEFSHDLGTLYCIPMEIEQVLLNMIKNAVHALTVHGTRPSARITLRVVMDDNLIRIDVEDNGCGITDQDLPHIFDPFYTTKDIGIGTGLGLSVAYGIINDNHNGHITVKTTVGKGTTMSIYLPVTGKEEEVST